MPQKIDHNKLWKYTKVILNVTMGLLYAFIGFFVIKKQWFMANLEPVVSYALGGLLIVYGIFRMYRVYKDTDF
ncbi:hypothetical protein [Jiulongibacter sp. NS-SX5]|uniref:hypothetical protein n=1 Tax=Jiulongibacter sp. NS-SX5 TaxID=3463854 RepID=UPI0040584D4E